MVKDYANSKHFKIIIWIYLVIFYFSSHVPNDDIRVEKSFQAHYELGDLGIVPRKTDHILTNLEKKIKTKPIKELGTLQKLLRRTVATQTIDYTKASLFGINDEYIKRENRLHPIYDELQQKETNNDGNNNSRIKSNYLMPLNDQHRNYKVTSNVF